MHKKIVKNGDEEVGKRHPGASLEPHSLGCQEACTILPNDKLLRQVKDPNWPVWILTVLAD